MQAIFLGVANGMLFINFVPVTVFDWIAQGHHFLPIELSVRRW
jgi:hypothetical protein